MDLNKIASAGGVVLISNKLRLALNYGGNSYTINNNDQQLSVYQVHTISRVFVTTGNIDIF